MLSNWCLGKKDTLFQGQAAGQKCTDLNADF